MKNRKITILILVTLFSICKIDAQNLLQNSGFETGSGLPTERDELSAKCDNWVSFKGHPYVDWLTPNLSGLNAFYFENPNYDFSEIDRGAYLTSYQLCFNRIIYTDNPYDPFEATADVEYGGIFYGTYSGIPMQTYIDKLENGGNYFMGLNAHAPERVGFQQELSNKINSGTYELSFYWSVPNKYTSNTVKFFISEDKNTTGKKIAVFKNDDGVADGLSGTIIPGTWYHRTISITLDLWDSKKYDWFVVMQENCGLEGDYPEASVYIFLDDIRFSLIEENNEPNCSFLSVDDKTYSNTTISGSVEKHFSNSITTSGDVTIESGASVLWTAGAYIDLNEDFYVEDGASFSAEISPCEDFIGKSAIDSNENIPTDNQPFDFDIFTEAEALMQKNSISIKVYPNPNSGKFRSTLHGNKITDKYSISIKDITGRELFKKVCYENEIDIELTNANIGIYIMTLEFADKVYTKKIVVN